MTNQSQNDRLVACGMPMPATSSLNSAKPLSRKERERSARRLEIVRAARSVFAEKGFEKATLEEIAERAELGKGTVYNYFDSKDSLFLAATADLLDEVRAIAERVAHEKRPVRESFGEYARQMIGYYRANYAFARMVMRVWGRPGIKGSDEMLDAIPAHVQSVAEPLAQLLKAAMRRKEVRHADAKVMAVMFIGLVHHYFMHQSAHASPKPAKDLEAEVELIVSVFFDGITSR
jgi:AcrR family transcriptional regulator